MVLLFTLGVVLQYILSFVDVIISELPVRPVSADRVTVSDVKTHYYKECFKVFVATHLIKNLPVLKGSCGNIIYSFACFPSIHT
jgi:hypothetical protein